MSPETCAAPGETEQVVNQAALIAEVEVFLKERVGLVNLDFARNLQENGGDSLAATLLSAYIRSKFNVDCPAAKLLGKRSLEEILCDLEFGAGMQIEIAKKADEYPLSDQQLGVVFDQIKTPLGKQYNLPLYVEIKKTFDMNRFRRCMLSVLKRHAGLRMQIVLKDERLMQRIEELKEENFVINDKGIVNDLNEALIQFCQPFNLEAEPLYRVAKISCANKTYLLFDMHHVVTDGYSKKILFDQIDALYAGRYPAFSNLAYIDYACWAEQQKRLPNRAKSLEYWKSKLFPLPSRLDLPTDYIRPAVRSADAGCVTASLALDDFSRLQAVARRTGVTMYEALIAAYSVVIGRIADTNDFILGSPALGRNVSGTAETVGMFASTACYRIKIDFGDSFVKHLQNVADEVRMTTQQEFFPFDELVKLAAHGMESPMERHPICDLMLAFHAKQLVNVELDGHPVVWDPAATKSAIFDLHMHIFERKNELDISLLFNSSIFSIQTASDLLSAYSEVVKKMTNHPEKSMESVL